MGVLRSLARGTALAGAVVAGGALVVTARSILATPQPLASALEGESQVFRFRNGDVFYKVRGPADAQPVLLLHSIHLSASSFEWRKNFGALSQSFRVYAPDLPGFGLSDRPAIDYNPDVYINLITDFAREIIARPAMLVARGQSAAFATRAAHLDPQLFSRLVFISPSGILQAPPAERREGQARQTGALRSLLRRLSETSFGQVPYAFLTTRPALSLFIARQSYANPEEITPYVVEQFFATTHQFGARFAPLAFMSGKLDTDVADDFASLRQPILLVWGEQDTINPTTSARALGRLNPRSRLEFIPAAGNAVQEEQASEINELLRAWFLAPPELLDPAHKAQALTGTPPAPERAAPAAAPTAPVASPEPAPPIAPEAIEAPPEIAPETPLAPAPEAAPLAKPLAGNGRASEAPMVPPEAPAAETPHAQTPAGTADFLTQQEARSASERAYQAPAAPTPETPAAPKEPPPKAAQRKTPPKAATPGQTRQGRAAQPASQPEEKRQASPDTEGKPPQRPHSSKKKK